MYYKYFGQSSKIVFVVRIVFSFKTSWFPSCPSFPERIFIGTLLISVHWILERGLVLMSCFQEKIGTTCVIILHIVLTRSAIIPFVEVLEWHRSANGGYVGTFLETLLLTLLLTTWCVSSWVSLTREAPWMLCALTALSFLECSLYPLLCVERCL